MENARVEYLFVYSFYVIEATTSNRLTYFYLPFNLIPLIMRPLRLFISADTLKYGRIVLLKATHWPFVACIHAYETWRLRLSPVATSRSSGRPFQGPNHATTLRRPMPQRWMYEGSIAEGMIGKGLDDQAQGDVTSSTTPPSAPLEALVESLKTQVDEIAQALARERGLYDSPG